MNFLQVRHTYVTKFLQYLLFNLHVQRYVELSEALRSKSYDRVVSRRHKMKYGSLAPEEEIRHAERQKCMFSQYSIKKRGYDIS